MTDYERTGNAILPDHNYAEDREETDPCEKGTIGCSIAHSPEGPETTCQTW